MNIIELVPHTFTEPKVIFLAQCTENMIPKYTFIYLFIYFLHYISINLLVSFPSLMFINRVGGNQYNNIV